MALDGIRFPQEMAEKSDFKDDDKVILSDSEDSKKAKFYTFLGLKNWILTFVSGVVAAFLDFESNLENPAYKEGRVFYDSDKKALSGYNEQDDIILNYGEELLSPIVKNVSGVDIFNGQPVYLDNVDGDYYTIKLANAKEKQKSRSVYVATVDILDGNVGRVTVVGEVGDYDTSAYSVGDFLYLSKTDGVYSLTPPDDGAYTVRVAQVKKVGPDGIIYVKSESSEFTVEVTDTNGFPPDQRAATQLVPLVSSRLMSILPLATGESFHYYERGDKYETTADAVTWTDLEGEHWFFYEEGIFTHEYNPSAARQEHIILNHAFVTAIYWDATNKEIIADVQDERHGISMSPYTHLYLHLTRGAQWVSGYSLGDFDADGDGDLDSSAQFSVSAGLFFDEDIEHSETGLAVGSTIPVLYNLGANANIRQSTNTGFIVLTGANGRAVYNEWTGTEWILSEVPHRDAVCYHIFGFNGQTVKTVAVVGQAEYRSVNAARDGAATEISNLISQLPFPEMIPVGTIVYETRNAYDNAIKSRVRTIDGANYIPWTDTELSQGAAPSSHANLTDVEVAAVDVTRGHIDHSIPLQLPKLSTAELALITAVSGMKVYNTTENQEQIFDGVSWVAVALTSDISDLDSNVVHLTGDETINDVKTFKAFPKVEGSFSDWFLPSKEELSLMHLNLKAEGVGGFVDELYWSSSEDGDIYAWRVDFTVGYQGGDFKNLALNVRAARAFTSTTAYALRDIGEAGGLIFYVNGNDYLEAAPSDEPSKLEWSDVHNTLIGTTSTLIGKGQNNTNLMLAQSATATSALACDTKEEGSLEIEPTLDSELVHKEYVDSLIVNFEQATVELGNMNVLTDNLFSLDDNKPLLKSKYAGGISELQVDFDAGTYPNYIAGVSGCTINVTINGLDLFSSDVLLVDGLNILTPDQNISVTRNDSIEIQLITGTGSGDTGYTVFTFKIV